MTETMREILREAVFNETGFRLLDYQTDRLLAALSGRDGLVLVSREPTKEMIRAGQAAGDRRLSEWNGRECHLDGMDTVVEHAYRAMIRTAVPLPKGQD